MCIFQKLRSKNPAKQFQFSPLSVTNFKIGPDVGLKSSLEIFRTLLFKYIFSEIFPSWF